MVGKVTFYNNRFVPIQDQRLSLTENLCAINFYDALHFQKTSLHS